jgi:hypothetical protein
MIHSAEVLPHGELNVNTDRHWLEFRCLIARFIAEARLNPYRTLVESRYLSVLSCAITSNDCYC